VRQVPADSQLYRLRAKRSSPPSASRQPSLTSLTQMPLRRAREKREKN
jgi:hypothetical protein